MTETLPATPQGIARAANLLRRGALVAFPTETVYGLAADARNAAAVAGVFAAKGRPAHNPLIVHVADLSMAETLAAFDADAARLAQAFWPGPLTLVLPLRDGAGLPPAVTANGPNVALRLPAHPVAQALLRAFGGPLVGPSANPSGRISPTRAAHVAEGLGGRIAAVLDGGDCRVGVESTILATGGEGPVRLLRPGGIAADQIEGVVGPLATGGSDPARPIAPGQFASHYAPVARVRLNAAAAEDGEAYIGFGAPGPFTLSATGNLAEAAARLFHVLRLADAATPPQGTIAVAPVPETGLGVAINDRLRRAAAPRQPPPSSARGPSVASCHEHGGSRD
jgi:L-threonylcarbamoyladenylate synthase